MSPKIFSPVVSGSGVEIVHKTLSERIKQYQFSPISPLQATLPMCLKAYKGDAAIVHTIPDMGPSVFGKDQKNIVTFHGYSIDEQYINSQQDWKRRLYYRRFLRKKIIESVREASAVTVVSQFLAQMVQHDIGPIPNLQVIHNGVDLIRFYPITPEKKKDRLFRVLYVGKLVSRKGFNAIQVLANRFKGEIEFWAVGSGSVKRNDSTSLKIIPPVSHLQMPELFQQVDALLFPSIREGFGLVIAEAMASGLPVISSNTSAIPELIIEGKGGYLCEAGNHQQLQSALKKLANSANNCSDFGQYNRERAENYFSAEKMVKHYSDLFNHIANQ